MRQFWSARRAAACGVLFGFALALPLVPVDAATQGTPVTTAQAERAPIIDLVRLTGTVVSARTAGISTDLGGLVAEMKVTLGDRVKAGDPLVQLDAGLEELQLRRAVAATAEAREELAEARRRLRIARPLAQRNNLSQNELDARAAVVRIATARVSRLEAEEAPLRERVRRHTITAPFAGVVARQVAEVGEWLSPGATVVELVDMTRLFVDVPVPQRQFPKVSGDPEVHLHFDALPGKMVTARIEALVPVSDPTARTFTIRLRPDRAVLPLTPGMSAGVTFVLDTDQEGLVVPRDAVIRLPDGRTTVWVIEGSADAVTVAERQVVLGRAFDGHIHIRDGLTEGAEVVVRGNEALRPGQRVRRVAPPGDSAE